MVSIKDFARDNGVSYEAVRKQIKRYAVELEGHVHQQGRTQYLDDVAAAFLQEHRSKPAMVIYDEKSDPRVQKMEDRIKDLEAKLSEKEKLVEMAQRRADALQEKVGRVYALEEGKRAAEEEVKLLEGFVADAKAEIQVLTEEKAAEVAAAREAATRATEERFRSMGLLEFLRERKKGM